MMRLITKMIVVMNLKCSQCSLLAEKSKNERLNLLIRFGQSDCESEVGKGIEKYANSVSVFSPVFSFDTDTL